MIGIYFTETASILSSSAGANFPFDVSWGTAGTFMCAVQVLTGFERIDHKRPDIVYNYRFYCSSGTSIDERNRIQWNGLFLDVVQVLNPMAKGNHLEVLANVRV
jgi:head-tail adaptor